MVHASLQRAVQFGFADSGLPLRFRTISSIKQGYQVTATMGEESPQDFVEALQKHLERQPSSVLSQRDWGSVFGQAGREEVESVDAVVAEEFEQVNPD
jgi:hypothetical protein